MTLIALLLWLGLTIPSGLRAESVAVIQPAPIRDAQPGYVVVGSACSPRWGQDCPEDTATLTFDGDLSHLRCAAYHEALHLAIGPDTTALDGDGWWQEKRVYAETRAVVGEWCPR
jgi:hypothetical protein